MEIAVLKVTDTGL